MVGEIMFSFLFFTLQIVYNEDFLFSSLKNFHFKKIIHAGENVLLVYREAPGYLLIYGHLNIQCMEANNDIQYIVSQAKVKKERLTGATCIFLKRPH